MLNEKPPSSSHSGLLVVLAMALMSTALMIGYALGRTRFAPKNSNSLPPNVPVPPRSAAAIPLSIPRLGWLKARVPALPAIQRQRLGLAAGILAFVCLFLAGWNFRWVPFSIWTTPFLALNWTLLGVVLAAVSVSCLRPHFAEFAVSRSPAKTFPINWIAVALSILALYVVGDVNSIPLKDTARLQESLQLDSNLQFLLLVAGTLGLIVGFGGFLHLRIRLFTVLNSRQSPRIGLIVVGIVELCAPALVPLLFGVALSPVLSVILVGAGLLSVLYSSGLFMRAQNRQAIGARTGALRRFNPVTWARAHMSPHVVALSLIVALGFVLRVWHLDTAVHVTVDEMHFWTGVLALRNLPTMHLFKPIDAIASFAHIFPYFQQFAVNVFGPDLFAMRLPSAITGTLTILAIYFLVRQGLDKKTALIAAALLAVFPPHIHFSRSALNNVTDLLPGTLALAFLIRGLKTNSQRDYVLAGVCFGWTAYFYEGGRLLFLGLFIAYLVYLLVTRRPWTHLRHWLLMGICAVLLFFPFYYAMSGSGYSASMRLIDRAVPEIEKYTETYDETHSLAAVFQQYYDDGLKLPFYHIFYSPDSSKLYYGGYTALLLWFMVPFLFLGAVLALLVFRRLGGLLLLWIFLTGLGASVVGGSDWTARVVVYFVPIVVLLAIGLRYPLEMLLDAVVAHAASTAVPPVDQEALRPKLKVMLYALLTGAVICVGAYQVQYYFTTHLSDYNRQVRQYRYDFLDAFYRAIEANPSSHLIYVVSGEPGRSLSEDELNIWIEFKRVSLSYQVVNVADFTPQSITQWADLHKEHTLIFAIEPPEVFVDEYGNPLDSPRVTPAFQQVRDLIMKTYDDVLEETQSPYQTVPLIMQYQLFIVSPGK